MATETKTDQQQPDEAKDGELLLDLSEPVEHPLIKGPDGTAYYLHVADDFSANESHAVNADIRDFGELMDKRKLTRADRERLPKLLHDIFDQVIDAPPEARVGFNDAQRQRVVTFFRTYWLGEEARILRAATEQLQSKIEPTTEN